MAKQNHARLQRFQNFIIKTRFWIGCIPGSRSSIICILWFWHIRKVGKLKQAVWRLDISILLNIELSLPGIFHNWLNFNRFGGWNQQSSAPLPISLPFPHLLKCLGCIEKFLNQNHRWPALGTSHYRKRNLIDVIAGKWVCRHILLSTLNFSFGTLDRGDSRWVPPVNLRLDMILDKLKSIILVICSAPGQGNGEGAYA